MDENEFIKVIKKNLPKYLSASLINAVVGVFMNKYYTYIFLPDEYGILAMYMVFSQYLLGIMAFTADSAWQRCYFNYKHKMNIFLGTILTLCITSISVVVFLLLVFGQQINAYLGGTMELYYITILLSIIAMYVKFVNLISYNENLSGLVLRQNLWQIVFNHGISVLLITWGNLGLMGRQIGQCSGYIINAMIYSKELINKNFLLIRWGINKEVLMAIKPFVLSAFSTLIITSTLGYMDRFILMKYHGATNVGIYTLGLMLGQGISLVIEAVSISLFPTIIKSLSDDYKGSIEKLKKLDKIWFLFLLMIVGIIYIIRTYIVVIFANESYMSASAVIPMIALAYVPGGSYKAVSNVLSFHNKVGLYPIIAGISYLSALGLNFLLVPEYGEIGAAFSMFIGSWIYSFLLHIWGRNYYFKLIETIPVYVSIFFLGTLMFICLK